MIIFPTFNNPSKWVTLVGGGSTNQLFHGPKWLNLKKSSPRQSATNMGENGTLLGGKKLEQCEQNLGWFAFWGMENSSGCQKAPLENPLWKTWWCKRPFRKYFISHSWTNQDVNGGILLTLLEWLVLPISTRLRDWGKRVKELGGDLFRASESHIFRPFGRRCLIGKGLTPKMAQTNFGVWWMIKFTQRSWWLVRFGGIL